MLQKEYKMDKIYSIVLEITSVMGGIVDIKITSKDNEGNVFDVHKFSAAQGETITLTHEAQKE